MHSSPAKIVAANARMENEWADARQVAANPRMNFSCIRGRLK